MNFNDTIYNFFDLQILKNSIIIYVATNEVVIKYPKLLH